MNPFIIFCCKPFLRSHETNKKELYDLLELDRSCTTEEAKRAYKRKSLQYHPDKLAQRGKTLEPEDQARFQRIKDAYEILSDPRRKKLYDEYGEKGMKFIEDPSNFDPQMLAENFLHSSNADRCRILILVTAVISLLLLFPILFCLRADNTIDGHWTAIATPLWIVDCILLLNHTYMVFFFKIELPEGVELDLNEQFPLYQRVYAALRFLCIVSFEILLVLKLDGLGRFGSGAPDSQWGYIFIPVFAILGSELVVDIYRAKPWYRDVGPDLDQLDAEEPLRFLEHETKRLKEKEARQEGLKDLWWNFILSAFCVLLVTRLATSGTVLSGPNGWWIVFAPIWVYLAARFAFGALYYRTSKVVAEGVAKPSTEAEFMALPVEDQAKVEASQEAWATSMKLLSSGCCTLIFVLLVVLRIAQVGAYSTFILFLPAWVGGGLLLCCMYCAICCARGDMFDDEEDEEGGTGGANADGEGAEGEGEGEGNTAGSTTNAVHTAGAGGGDGDGDDVESGTIFGRVAGTGAETTDSNKTNQLSASQKAAAGGNKTGGAVRGKNAGNSVSDGVSVGAGGEGEYGSFGDTNTRAGAGSGGGGVADENDVNVDMEKGGEEGGGGGEGKDGGEGGGEGGGNMEDLD